MKRKLINDLLLRQYLKKKETKEISLKVLIRSRLLNYIEILHIYSKIKKNTSISKLNNRCFITSRGRGVNKLTKISRIKLRELTKNGLISGIKKLNW